MSEEDDRTSVRREREIGDGLGTERQRLINVGGNARLTSLISILVEME